ncbi:FAM91A1-like protein, partial [Trifolium medium]|nr:FAM91A1-like protein [Trifolium medium]
MSLKSHAVTLYEAGKLGHASISDLCKDLSTLEGAKFEGELQEFANHAFSLRCVLECLQSGGVACDVKVDEGFHKMDMATPSNDESSSLTAEISLAEKSGDSGITETETNNDELLSLDLEKSAEASVSFEAVPSDGTSSITLEGDDNDIQDSSKDENLPNDKKLMVEGSDVGREMLKSKKKYRVDILRCESLASLAPATLDRLFLRDYDIVVSIVPLPQSSVLPGPAESGPLSVVLMKGQCLRLLPAPLAGCEKALIWSWDGSTVGGLGGKLEGNLVQGSILLHCLNSVLKHSAVLVLPL